MLAAQPSSDKPASLRARIVVRIFVFCVVMGFVGGYSRVLQSSFTRVFPRTCAAGKTGLFTVDFDSYPTRIGDQDNLCAGVSDGHCTRSTGEEFLHGECLHEQMDGAWSVTSTSSGSAIWSGTYCEGLPCGRFRTRVDSGHENEFYLDKLHLHGAAKIWELRDNRQIEFSGRYENGRRSGQWIRYLEPAHTRLESLIYDKAGFLTTTTHYCTNGNRREIRGNNTFLFDAQGNLSAKRPHSERGEGETNGAPEAGANDASHCPMP